MESPLDILSRAAGMVSGSSTNSSPVPTDAVVVVTQPQVLSNSREGGHSLPMRLVTGGGVAVTSNKRKFEEGRGSGSSVEDDVGRFGGADGGLPASSVILKKALVTSPPEVFTAGGVARESVGTLGTLPFFKNKGAVMVKQPVVVAPFQDFEEDCQPLDMSCKKKRSSSPDQPILPYQLPLRQAPPPSSNLQQQSSSFNGVHHKKKWSAVLSNGDESNSNNHSLKEGNLHALNKIENNNSGGTTTSEGSGTDLRRPSVIYYATQTPGAENNGGGVPPVGLPPSSLPLSSGGAQNPLGVSGGAGGGGKVRRRYLHHLHNQRHPSGSSSSSSSEMSPLPPRRKHVKRKKKRGGLLAGLPLGHGGLPVHMRDGLLDVESSQRRIVVITSKEDDIDEHFRRSLGDRYDKCYKKEEESSKSVAPTKAEASPSPSSPTQPPVTTGASHSNSPINVKRDNSPPAAADLDMSFSVDDHFAKALGSETWSRISKGSNSVKSEEGGGPEGPDSRRSSCSLSSLPEKV